MKKRALAIALAAGSPLFSTGAALASGNGHGHGHDSAPDLAALQELGKRVFFDNISDPARQSCSSCHSSATGWTGPSDLINRTIVANPGADPRTVGGRKPPTIAYAFVSPNFGDSGLAPFPGACDANITGVFCGGGVFWDGRATGEFVGNEVFAGDSDLQAAFSAFLGPLADQALGPFPNDVEQNVPDGDDNGLPGAEAVCRHVKRADYSPLYRKAWGESIDCRESVVDVSFKRIAVAISAWEHSEEVNSFSSKRDIALARDTDSTPGAFPLEDFSNKENLGHDLFYGITSPLNPTGKNANCSACHNSEGPGSTGAEPAQLYSDQGFHHLGLPPNADIANFDPANPDFGLSHHTFPDSADTSGHAGHFRTPTLRNVAKKPSRNFTKAYMHNGYFKNLEDVVHFYNTATLKLDPVRCPAGTTAAQARRRDCWPQAEVNNGGQASGVGLLGNLGLTAAEEKAIVAYLETLSDTKTVQPPKKFKKWW
jgi:cytochrome c peroxidase